MTTISQKTTENPVWDINGEDYWIINEDNSEQILHDKTFQNVSGNSDGSHEYQRC
ncbi:MAG TPA: hypothetical protein VJ571_02845 [Candidatus Nitrosotalea sp.]|nr:hypothetical protein [Candidatus Nitrosotalea sp.]